MTPSLAVSPSSALQEAPWEELLPQAHRWADRLASGFRCVRGGPSPEDLVHDAVADFLTGRRSIPTGVPIAVALYGAMRSRTSHVVAQARVPGQREPRKVGIEEAEGLPGPDASDAVHGDDLRRRVLRRVAGDPLLGRIVELWFEDPALMSADLAAILGVPVHEVYKAARRFRRLAGPTRPVSGEKRDLDETSRRTHAPGETCSHAGLSE